MAKPGKGAVEISVNRAETFVEFMGASCPATVPPMKPGLTFFNVVPPRDGKGLVAVKVWHYTGAKLLPFEEYFFLLTAGYNAAGEPNVNLFSHIAPDIAGLIQLNEEGLFVISGDKKFVAPDYGSKSEARLGEMRSFWADENYQIVPDANLLCRFAVGDATLEQVQTAAETVKQEEAWPAQKAALEKQLAEAKQHAEYLVTEIEAWSARFGRLVNELAEADGKLADATAKSGELYKTSRTQEIRLRSDANRIDQLEATIKLITREAEESAGFGHRSRTLDWIRSFGLNALVVKTPNSSPTGEV